MKNKLLNKINSKFGHHNYDEALYSEIVNAHKRMNADSIDGFLSFFNSYEELVSESFDWRKSERKCVFWLKIHASELRLELERRAYV